MRTSKRIGTVRKGRPAPGYRYNTSGISGSVGNNGYSWSCTTNSVYGLDLSFSSQHLSVSGSDHRTRGFQLRCLSE